MQYSDRHLIEQNLSFTAAILEGYSILLTFFPHAHRNVMIFALDITLGYAGKNEI